MDPMIIPLYMLLQNHPYPSSYVLVGRNIYQDISKTGETAEEIVKYAAHILFVVEMD